MAELLPTIIGHPGASIDVAHPRYIAMRDAAAKAGFNQDQFSRALMIEVEIQTARAAKAAPETPTAAAPGKIPGYDQMSFRVNASSPAEIFDTATSTGTPLMSAVHHVSRSDDARYHARKPHVSPCQLKKSDTSEIS